jgi:hypothetical protein
MQTSNLANLGSKTPAYVARRSKNCFATLLQGHRLAGNGDVRLAHHRLLCLRLHRRRLLQRLRLPEQGEAKGRSREVHRRD